MTATAGPIVPITSFDELSPAFQERARRGRERLGVIVNSLHAFAHSVCKLIATRSRAVSASLSGCQIAANFASDTPSPASW